MNFESVIAPMDPTSFREAIAVRLSPVYIPGTPEKFSKLFSVDALWDCVRRGKPEGSPVPRASLTAFQLPVAFESGAIDRALRSGNTVCVSHIDRVVPALRTLCLDTESALGLPGSACVHCYTSPPGTGYDFFHVDSGVAVTLQIAGKKKWQYAEHSAIPWSTRVGGFRENNRLDWFGSPEWQPLPGSFPVPDEQDIVEQTLVPGDLLVMPAGVWHRVQATDSTSVSLNLKLTHTASVDSLLEMVRHACLDDAYWRQPLPFATPEELRDGVPCEDTRNVLHERLLSLSDTIRALASDKAKVSTMWFRNFLGSQADVVGDQDIRISLGDRLTVPDRLMPRLSANDDGSATLLGQGKILTVRGYPIAPLLREILSRRSFLASEVDSWPAAHGFSSLEICDILQNLARAGFLKQTS